MDEFFKRIVRIPSRKRLVKANLESKRVLVRFDFNIPIEGGKIEDDRKIKAAMPTLKEILAKGASEINIICHLGQPEGKKKPEFSTQPIAKYIAKILKMPFKAKAVFTGIKSASLDRYYQIGRKIRFFENIRFDPGEEKKSKSFAKQLAALGDIFVFDAFASIHRNHVSTVEVQKLLPTYCGFLVEKEINTLFRIFDRPKRPFVAIIGGAKIKDKLPIIEALSKKTEAIIVGGKTANEWIGQGHERSGNIFLPNDGINKLGLIVPINEQTLKHGIYDIGPQTIMLFKSILSSAKTIFWNGNLGMTEKRKFVHGTYEIIRYIAKLKAERIASGGNTAEVIDEAGLTDVFDFISTGGGATSDFIVGKKMPALEMLLK